MQNSISSEIETITELYKNKVLSQRIRRIELLGRRCKATIEKSFLGLELRLLRKRITCPDMVTARYLKVFAEIGLRSVSLPYDPTETARLLPQLEQSFVRLNDLLQAEASDSKVVRLRMGRTYSRIKRRLETMDDLLDQEGK